MSDPTPLIALDEPAFTWARARGSDAVLLAPEAGWEAVSAGSALALSLRSVSRLRALRMAGVDLPALLLAPPERMPERRGELEPMELVDPEGSPAEGLGRLARRPTREPILVATGMWGVSPLSRTRAVDMTISRLRRLIEQDPEAPEVLVTLAGSGYRYLAPSPAAESAPGFIGRTGAARRGSRLAARGSAAHPGRTARRRQDTARP